MSLHFLFDRCVPVRIARIVNAYEAEHTIRHHDEDARFTPTTPDESWMSILAADDLPWIVVSGDSRILRNKLQRTALEEAGLTFFCLSKQWPSMRIHEYAWKFLKVWPDVVANAATTRHKLFEIAGGKALKVFPVT